MSSVREKMTLKKFHRMESMFELREIVGVQDAVLLTDFTSEAVFLDNLSKRYLENIIYTYIGNVLVAVNPYRDLGLYSDEIMEQYRSTNFYQVPPSVFAITEAALRSMLQENENQCVLISGESGAGKTETSKHILSYLAAATHHASDGDMVRDRLLRSNPVLESFGNAKTNKNDNSSRFGKYMDVEANFKGEPVGGHILNYLLEKSRVVHQEKGERNFHVFYQLVAGATVELREKLHLSADPLDYHYLRQGECSEVASIDDAADFHTVEAALAMMGFTEEETSAAWRIVAAILHLGNVSFVKDEKDLAAIAPDTEAKLVAELLQCDLETLENSLTNKTIECSGEYITSPLTVEQAYYCRDSLAKSTYERLFNWLVGRLNTSLATKTREHTTLFGILDIYGFEIFDKNGYEQFCINYCNEKLQQVFIELTLRNEQEEYRREGIEWEEVKFFDNMVIINLIEEKHKGIISMMDEECLMPGDITDATLLVKLNKLLKVHEHFSSYETVDKDDKLKKTFAKSEFRLQHYAGEVIYCVDNFIDKNNDLLFRDLKVAMSTSSDGTVKQLYPKDELIAKKRPLTAATQFKQSLAHLMSLLMSKQPSYIRCIKPNDEKRAMHMDDTLVAHQIKYLGLMENLRVRRAGFAFRRPYEMFLQRYKSLSPQTWPHWHGEPREGARLIVEALEIPEDDYKLGKTKIFIRLPRTVFGVEDALTERKEELATLIQSHVKRVIVRKHFLRMRVAVILIAKQWRRLAAKKLLARRKWAAEVIRNFIKGFITRNEEVNDVNRRFQSMVKIEWLHRLSKNLPKSVLDKAWPKCPPPCQEASALLHKMHTQMLAARFVKTITPQRRAVIEEKILAETLFSGAKSSYMASVPPPFKSSRLDENSERLVSTAFENFMKPRGETTKYSGKCTKYDRNGYKPRDRLLIVTTRALYLLEANKDFTKLVQKHRLDIDEAKFTVSPNSDNFVLVHVPLQNKKDKGDLLLAVPNLIEAITKVVVVTKRPKSVSVADASGIEHTFVDGKKKPIRFDKGPGPAFSKNKDGAFNVVAVR